MRDIRSTLLVMLSVGLVGTWVYHLYDKTVYSSQRREVYIKDSAAVSDGVRDSLQKIYSYTISNLDTQLSSTKVNADSLKDQLGFKLQEIYTLKNDITIILKNRNATKADLTIAHEKIQELQNMVEALRNQNTSMEEEKSKLTAVLDQLSSDMEGLHQNMQRLDEENKSLTEKINQASVFIASEIKFMPVTVKNSREEETTLARKANKFVVSFFVQNNIKDYVNTEVYIVVLQPDGSVLKNSVWDFGTFDTRNEGKKPYTLKMHFQYQKAEAKQVLFSLTPDSYENGIYTMQIYHNGVMIGQLTKTLG
jgi:peptidoglycan hydrolase CwlO-like protein